MNTEYIHLLAKTNDDGILVLVIGAIIGAFFFLLPTMIAFNRRHVQKWAIFAVNMFGGILSVATVIIGGASVIIGAVLGIVAFCLAGLGWFIAFIWALLPSPRKDEPISVNVTVKQDQNLPAARFCPHCGNAVGLEVKYCPSCGNDVTSPERVHTSSLS